MTEKLKACPFCGHEAEICTNDEKLCGITDELEFTVCCTWCSGNSGWALTEDDAIAAWNRRVPHD